jgi:hypothetical protein
MWKEKDVALFDAPFQHMYGMTERHPVRPSDQQSIPGLSEYEAGVVTIQFLFSKRWLIAKFGANIL